MKNLILIYGDLIIESLQFALLLRAFVLLSRLQRR
jgi:hypothetical protein